jgi:hypothetical protein
MADYAALQEQNKLAALRAMAAGNPDPYAGSSGVISGAQDEALNRFAGDAAGRAAPQGSISQGEAMIRAPGDAALAGLGSSGAAQSAELAALKAEAENAAANPSSVPQYSSSASGGRQPTKEELQRAQGYNQYGGYNTAAEYENAVLGRATEMQGQKGQEVEQGKAEASNASSTASVPLGIDAVKAVQARNEAVVGGPGAVIHGIGWKDNPVPWTPPPAAAPPPPVVAHSDPSGQRGTIPVAAVRPAAAPPPAQEYVGVPGSGYWAPARAAGTPSTLERSNYTPEQTALLRAAADQAYNKWANFANITPAGPRLVAQAWDPRIDATEDPRNIYEYAQRAAVDELGGDRYEAMGRFSPEWGMKTYAEPLAQQPLDYQATQNEALERSNNQAAGLGAYTDSQVQARRTQTIRNSPDYATGAAVAEAQVATLAKGVDPQHPVTLDGLRAALAKAGVDPTAAAQVISDYGRLYPGSSYYTQPEELATAAQQAGSGQTPAAPAG